MIDSEYDPHEGTWVMRYRWRSRLLLVVLLFSGAARAEDDPRCLALYSYHVGYAWNDAIDQEVTEGLAGHCEVRSFYMDSKRNPDPAYLQQKAVEVVALIESWSPDVVIAVDDNASRYVVVPYLMERKQPVVFCGINGTAEEYGYPSSNITGMLEVSPVEPLLLAATRAVGQPISRVRAHLIDGDRLSAHKVHRGMQQVVERWGGTLEPHFVRNFEEWKAAYRQAQSGDLVVLVNSVGIEDWDQQEAERFVREHGDTISVSNNRWMRSLVTLTFAKIPEEQGEWSVSAVKRILGGTPASQISQVTNRRWKVYASRALVSRIEARIPLALQRHVEWVEQEAREGGR